MKELNVEGIRKIQLQILKNVSEYCDKNNIRYSLAYGTLIGSIRHKGYIPWDDDIDIAMPRPDYDNFIINFNGCIKDYSVHAAEIDSNFLYTFAKVSYDNSILIEETNIKYDIGINIDIFPIDGLPIDDNKKVMKKQNLYRNLANFKNVKLSYSRSIFKNIFLLLGKILLLWLPLKTINTKMIDNSKTYSFENEDYCCNISTGLMANKPIPRKYLEEYIEYAFENEKFNVSKFYDQWLLSIYGDYMKMPPKEKQVTHHKYKAYKK
ncbi:LicD family protein [Clostridium sp.]|uniref:LicD family protein n=1 Tax=Clostridium sp. TaxID=1506 RepID=UPI00290C7D14|nr:LicD family protein [Clostridium sp.]MDU5108231.1 LicD family protein [Clostridium sp.]